MSAATEKISDVADGVETAEAIFGWIAGNEGDEDKARTLADNEVLHRCAEKLRDVVAYLDAVENGDIEDPDL